MNRQNLKLLFTLFFCVLASSLQGRSLNRDKDFQFWFRDVLTVRLSKKFDFRFEAQYRFGADASELYFTLLQFNLGMHVCDWLLIAPGYRQIWRTDPFEEWVPIQDPLLDVHAFFDSRGWNFEFRSRTQHLFIEDRRNFWVQRFLFEAVSPMRWGNMKLAPFAAEEVFFREARGFSQNRFLVGGKFPIIGELEGRLFFMFRNEKSATGWVYHNILGIDLHFVF